MRHVVWFSCGAASAVAAKVAVDTYGDGCEVVYCDTSDSEHEDNLRFLADVERWIGRSVTIIHSDKYKDIDDVYEQTHYMAGIAGARCTIEMKKIPREAFQHVGDIHIFGYTSDEVDRAAGFDARNPSLTTEWILIDRLISKDSCFDRLRRAGIALPAMYGLGFDHNNCKACVKATSPGYWNRTRRHFPDVFERRARQSRLLGVRLARLDGVRIFLDELPLEADAPDDDIECGPVCQMTLEW